VDSNVLTFAGFELKAACREIGNGRRRVHTRHLRRHLGECCRIQGERRDKN
jgi:hypothetical protein